MNDISKYGIDDEFYQRLQKHVTFHGAIILSSILAECRRELVYGHPIENPGKNSYDVQEQAFIS